MAIITENRLIQLSSYSNYSTDVSNGRFYAIKIDDLNTKF